MRKHFFFLILAMLYIKQHPTHGRSPYTRIMVKTCCGWLTMVVDLEHYCPFTRQIMVRMAHILYHMIKIFMVLNSWFSMDFCVTFKLKLCRNIFTINFFSNFFFKKILVISKCMNFIDLKNGSCKVNICIKNLFFCKFIS